MLQTKSVKEERLDKFCIGIWAKKTRKDKQGQNERRRRKPDTNKQRKAAVYTISNGGQADMARPSPYKDPNKGKQNMDIVQRRGPTVRENPNGEVLSDKTNQPHDQWAQTYSNLFH